ncbi:replication-relaxation family protein [Streptomyces sp. AD681]|uniref:replication-relaxation family protein n=1 Tax=Streptomyces sp. AD681 TaxID=3019069 RepID=UPI002FDE361B
MPAAPAPSPIEPLPNQLLTAPRQHRMATTGQLQTMLRPTVRRQTVNTPLNRLRCQGLVHYTVLPRSRGMRAWYLTSDGVRMVKDFPALPGRPPYPITSNTAASLKTPHTLTVLRTHLAFVADARERGDQHGFLDWAPQMPHALGNGEKVITDAVPRRRHGPNSAPGRHSPRNQGPLRLAMCTTGRQPTATMDTTVRRHRHAEPIRATCHATHTSANRAPSRSTLQALLSPNRAGGNPLRATEAHQPRTETDNFARANTEARHPASKVTGYVPRCTSELIFHAEELAGICVILRSRTAHHSCTRLRSWAARRRRIRLRAGHTTASYGEAP